jgi:hypothetical protein
MVEAVIAATAISTGLPAITIGPDWPRKMPPGSMAATPAMPICFNAVRLGVRRAIRALYARNAVAAIIFMQDSQGC